MTDPPPPEVAAGILKQVYEGNMAGVKRALGDVFGLANFGVNLTTLEPGAKSSQRHWHAKEDEFIYVLSGEITLVYASQYLSNPASAMGHTFLMIPSKRQTRGFWLTYNYAASIPTGTGALKSSSTTDAPMRALRIQ